MLESQPKVTLFELRSFDSEVIPGHGIDRRKVKLWPNLSYPLVHKTSKYEGDRSTRKKVIAKTNRIIYPETPCTYVTTKKSKKNAYLYILLKITI